MRKRLVEDMERDVETRKKKCWGMMDEINPPALSDWKFDEAASE